MSFIDWMSNKWNRNVLAELAGLDRKLKLMSEREDAANARQAELIASVKDGWAALVARNAALEEALANADADKAAALEADSQADAERVEGANAALDELLNPPAPEEPQP